MDIAVIGIAGRFPQANNLDELLEVLTSGVDAVQPIDPERLSKTTVPANKEYVEMAYLNDVDLFDYKYFNYPKAEANKMSPQHRLTLQTVHHALEDTGYPLSAFDGSGTSVYCGSPTINYDKHWEGEIDPTVIMGASEPFLSGRISRIFNLRGNSVTIDTTCSSSLVALHTAVNDLKCGDSDCSVVVGVNIEDFPVERKIHVSSEELGVNILSSSYRAKTFSDQADGTGIGEAVVAVVIKPLEKAKKDGDRIHAVIKSTAVNQDAGLSASLTAPDSQAQSEVIQDAWEKAKINPADVGYIEAHGTGTKLGDPIEVEGLSMAFKAFTDQKQFCSVSSIKSNFGHTDSAAGLVGLTKVILSLKHRKKFQSVHFETPNPFIDFENAPVYVQTETEEWNSHNGKYIAGVSAFGLTGTNCHVVLEAFSEEKKPSIATEKEYLFPVSGRDDSALERNIEALKKYLNQHPELNAGDVAATLCKGRDHHTTKKLFKAKSIAELKQVLEHPKFLKTEPVEKIILVFSDLKLNKTDFQNFLKNAPVLNKELNSLCSTNQIDLDALSEKESVIALQVAMYNTLKKAGVTSEFLMGDGIGKLSIRFIKGQVALKDVIAEAENANAEKENFSERIQRFVEGQTKETRVGFFEMGFSGSISKEINKQTGNFELAVANLEDGFFGLLHQAFSMGINLNWNLWFTGDEKKVSLPGYAFEATRCWLREPYEIVESNELSDNVKLHSATWINVERKEVPEPKKEHILVVVNTSDQKQYFEDWFSDHQITFVSGLHEEIEDNVKNPISIFVDSVNFFPSKSETEEIIFEQLDTLKAVSKLNLSDQLKYVFLSTDGFEVKEGESTNPAVYASTAFAKSLNADRPVWEVMHVDFKSTDRLSEIDLLKEIKNTEGKAIVAFRDGKTFEQEYSSQSLAELETHEYTNGDYLLTGGASGIGAIIAGRIADQIETGRLFILGRSEENERLKTLEELRKINANVSITYHSIDVANGNEVELYAQELKNIRVNKLEALIHAAGVGMGSTSLFEETNETFNGVMAPKYAGLLNLTNAMTSFAPKKTLLFSSLNAVLPYAKSASYAVANAFMDGYAENKDHVLSIGWIGWQGIGMSKESNEKEFLLTEKEFLGAFDRVMTISNGHVLVTKGDIAQFSGNPYAHLKGAAQQSEPEEELPIREYIHRLWVKILEEPDVSWDDDFFDLGGHSLIGAQMVNILKGKYKVDLEFEDIYEYATINELANFIEETGTVSAENDEIKAVSEEEKKYPLTAAQEGIWVVSQMEERRSDFNMAGLVELKGELDLKTLKKAVQIVTEKHETLRSVFSQTDQGIVQEVLEMDCVPDFPELIKTDFTNLGQAIEEIKVAAWEYGFAPFKLDSEIPLRIRLYSDENEHHVLVFVTHHIVSDGVSLDLFTEELFENYYAVLKNPNHQPIKLKGTFRNHVSAQQVYFDSEDYQSDKVFWENQLTGKIPRLKLPDDIPRAASNPKVGDTTVFTFSEEDRQILDSLRKTLKISPFLLYTALVKLLLFKYHGSDHITIGIPYFGRDDAASQRQIGLFVNLLPLQTRVEEGMSFVDLVTALKETYLNALKHKRYPFEHMIKAINSGGQKFEDTIYDVSVNYWEDQKDLYTADDYVAIGGDLQRRIHTFDESAIQDDIAFEFSGENSTTAFIKYNKNRFKHITIELMAERLLQLIKNLENNINEPVMNVDFNPTWALGESLAQTSRENLDENF